MSAAATAAAGGGGAAKPKTNYGSATSAGGALAAFAAYDKDGDGKIDANELLSLDTDGDGIVSEEEIAEVLRRMKARPAAVRPHCARAARSSWSLRARPSFPSARASSHSARAPPARPLRRPRRRSATFLSTRRSASRFSTRTWRRCA
jgi:hypothetical protein